mgnify:CR=1 FL=1
MITIYGTATCKWCKSAVELTKSRSLAFTYKDMSENPDLYDELVGRMGGEKNITVPKIWWNDTYVGGYSQLAQMIEDTIGGYGDGKI